MNIDIDINIDININIDGSVPMFCQFAVNVAPVDGCPNVT